MSDIGKNALKTKIDNKVYENSSQAITGTIMNEVLQDVVDTLADGGNLDAESVNTANIADGAVTDAKLQNPVSVSQNSLTIGGDYRGELSTTYDVTLHNSGATFASLEALLSDANLNTLIPTNVRKGGMSIKFVQTSDNKYVQYFCKSESFTTVTDDWEKMNNGDEMAALDEVLEIISIPTLVEKTINNEDFTNEGYFVKTDGTLQSAEAWMTTPFISIVPETDIRAKLTNGSDAAVLAFYSSDNENSFLSYWNANTGCETNTVVPSGANYFRACTGRESIIVNDAFVDFIQTKVNKESERITNIESDINNLETENSTINDILDIQPDGSSEEVTLDNNDFTVDGYYVKTDGTLATGEAWKSTSFLSIKQGTRIESKLTSGSDAAVMAFYSSDNESSFISSWNGNTGNIVSSTVPSGAKYFRACTGKGIITTEDAFVKYLEPIPGSTVLTELKDDVQSLKSKLPPKNTGKSWCSIGDSITWLNDHTESYPITKGYQDVVQENLIFTHFYNRGMSGYTAISYSADANLNNLEVADFYTIFLGINDWGNTHLSPVGTLSDYKNFTTGSATNYAEAVKKIINKCKTLNPNSVILLFTPRRGKNFDGFLPSSSLDPNDAGIYLYQFADIIREVSEYEGLPLVDLYYHSGVNDANLTAFSYDNALHPNDAGMRIIGQMLYDKMKDFVL